MSRSPRKPEKPVLWIIAGPNGSGKSSLYGRTDIEGWGGSVWIINPDLLTDAILDHEQVARAWANEAALNRIEDWLYACLQVYQTIGVETVLSSFKYRRLVRAAKRSGYEIRLIYVVLQTVDLQLERIKLRVLDGGHDVPDHKVRARRARSFQQLMWFARKADQLFIFDNSTSEPKLVMERVGGEGCLHLRALPPDLHATATAYRLLA